MSHILAVGIATLDIINSVSHYPAEDDELRALSQRQARGGNATNTLAVLSQLGHDCAWAGVLIDEPDSQIIEADLAKYRINTAACTRLDHGKMPTSYITLNQQSGTRTIVHHRDCPEFTFEAFCRIDLAQFDWLHFEGRHIADTAKMINHLKTHYPQLPCSVEIEKPRQHIDQLFDGADLLLFSRQYVESCGYSDAATFLSQQQYGNATCTWGEQGAWYLFEQQVKHCPASPPPQLVDTLGAGDTFNAGVIDMLVRQHDLPQAVEQACRLAGRKCGQPGLQILQ